MALETLRWDIIDHLDTGEKIAAYSDAVLADGDPAEIRDAVVNIARARVKSRRRRDAQPPE